MYLRIILAIIFDFQWVFNLIIANCLYGLRVRYRLSLICAVLRDLVSSTDN